MACFRVLGIEGDSGGSRDGSGSEMSGRGQRDMGTVRNVSEYWAVNGRETLGPSAPSVVTDHESGWPNSDGLHYLNP